MRARCGTATTMFSRSVGRRLFHSSSCCIATVASCLAIGHIFVVSSRNVATRTLSLSLSARRYLRMYKQHLRFDVGLIHS